MAKIIKIVVYSRKGGRVSSSSLDPCNKANSKGIVWDSMSLNMEDQEQKQYARELYNYLMQLDQNYFKVVCCSVPGLLSEWERLAFAYLGCLGARPKLEFTESDKKYFANLFQPYDEQ